MFPQFFLELTFGGFQQYYLVVTHKIIRLEGLQVSSNQTPCIDGACVILNPSQMDAYPASP